MSGNPFAGVVRVVHVAVVLFSAIAAGAPAAILGRSWSPLARALSKGLEHLGPAFIKLGQFLSVRPDLLPASALAEFERLQDRALPIPFSCVARVVREELFAPPEQLFAHIDPVPLASASLSQVHRARLHDGSEVVLKVRRPGVAGAMRRDFRLLTGMVRLLVSVSPLRQRFDPEAFAVELEHVVAQELDFRVEGERAEVFRRNFRNLPGLRIPRVHWRLSGRRVLVSEFIPGVKISAAGSRDREDYRELAERGAVAFLQQVFVDGMFHADLHPANVLITPGGEIAYLDFGIVGTLNGAERAAIRGALVGLLARDTHLALRHLGRLGVRVPPDRVSAFAADIAKVMDEAMGPTLVQVSMTRVGRGILAAAHRNRVFFPRRQALLIKALLTVEGCARLLHPRFSFETAARKYLFRQIGNELSWSRLAEGVYRAGALIGLAASVAADLPAVPVPSDR